MNRTASTATSDYFAGYVLAGGGSTRFGRDKALVEVDGKPMLARMIELLRGAAKEGKVVAVRGKYEAFGVEIIEDRWPGEGPLGGIITALEDAAQSAGRAEWNLIVSCDMPFLTRAWLEYMATRAARSAAQVILPHPQMGQSRCARAGEPTRPKRCARRLKGAFAKSRTVSHSCARKSLTRPSGNGLIAQGGCSGT